LQVYRFGTTNTWVTPDSTWTNATCSANTDCTITPTAISTNLSEYYEADGSNYLVHFRLYQASGTSKTLKTDTFREQAGVSKAVFTNAARTLTAQYCGTAVPFTLELENASSSPTAPTSATVMRVTSNSGSLSVYSDSSCTSLLTNGDVSFTTSDTSKTIYITDGTASTPTWTLTATKQSGPDVITNATQSYTVNPGTDHLAFTNAARTLATQYCSGSASSFTVQIQKSDNTAIAPAGTTIVQISSSSSNTRYYADSNCSIPLQDGNLTFTTVDTSKTFYVLDNVVSNPTWTLTATKTSGPNTLSAATQTYIVNNPPIINQIKGGVTIRGGTKL
jgi:hypothetical protein